MRQKGRRVSREPKPQETCTLSSLRFVLLPPRREAQASMPEGCEGRAEDETRGELRSAWPESQPPKIRKPGQGQQSCPAHPQLTRVT